MYPDRYFEEQIIYHMLASMGKFRAGSLVITIGSTCIIALWLSHINTITKFDL